MDVYEKLEELQEKALHDETMKQALLATRTEKEPIIAFCKKCQEFGYEIYPMELINAGEEFYATMRRSKRPTTCSPLTLPRVGLGTD